MEIVILADAESVASVAADIIQARVEDARAQGGRAVLGLATGSTPLGTYRELIRRHRHNGLSFADTEAFTLDEYLGLPPEHPESYRSVIRRELTDSIDLPDAAVHSLDGQAPDPEAEAARYEAAIAAAGGVDIQILGIGTDGHIGFNEPMSSLASRTRIKTLTDQTRRDNARCRRPPTVGHWPPPPASSPPPPSPAATTPASSPASTTSPTTSSPKAWPPSATPATSCSSPSGQARPEPWPKPSRAPSPHAAPPRPSNCTPTSPSSPTQPPPQPSNTTTTTATSSPTNPPGKPTDGARAARPARPARPASRCAPPPVAPPPVEPSPSQGPHPADLTAQAQGTPRLPLHRHLRRVPTLRR